MSAQSPLNSDSLDRRGLRILWWALIGCLAAWALINLQWGRAIAWDEVEFLRATDWIRQGQVPYRDFFEHHAPLTWFLMAPLEALRHGPGVDPVLWLRWMQVPLWGMAIWRVNIWMREGGGSSWSRYLALGCLLGTPFFVFNAIEYRVDTLGTLLVILALDRFRRPGLRQACLAGGLLTASVLANLRFGPLAVTMALAASSLDSEAGRWCFRPRRLGAVLGGAAIALVPWLLYLAVTHSFWDMWHWCVIANAVTSASVSASRDFVPYLWYPISNWDLPGVLLELGMVAGGWQVVRGFRKPGFIHLVLLTQVANLIFVWVMKVQYLYHFELILCLAVPFLAIEADRIAALKAGSRVLAWAGPGVLAFAITVNGSTLASANNHPTMAYQDEVLREAARLAPSGSTVLDGCGWLLDSKPAYRFWFLPVLARVLYLRHQVAPYTLEDMRKDPPALVIANMRLGNMASENPDIGAAITTQYLPSAPNLWTPGLSRVLDASSPVWTWTVMGAGDYQLLCGPGLALHPWFHSPWAFTTPIPNPSVGMMIDPATFTNSGEDQIQWVLDGEPVKLREGSLKLARGQSLTARFTGTGAIGVMLVRKGMGPVFSPPPPNLTLDYITFNSYWPHP